MGSFWGDPNFSPYATNVFKVVRSPGSNSGMSMQALGPLAFYDVRGNERSEEGSTSLVNDEEAKMVMFLYAELVTRYSQLSSGANIAVISPYKAQVCHPAAAT